MPAADFITSKNKYLPKMGKTRKLYLLSAVAFSSKDGFVPSLLLKPFCGRLNLALNFSTFLYFYTLNPVFI